MQVHVVSCYLEYKLPMTEFAISISGTLTVQNISVVIFDSLLCCQLLTSL